jgi:hypothetical protein
MTVGTGGGVGTGVEAGVGAAFPAPPVMTARYWGLATTAITSTISRPPARVRISPLSTQSTGEYTIKKYSIGYRIKNPMPNSGYDTLIKEYFVMPLLKKNIDIFYSSSE